MHKNTSGSHSSSVDSSSSLSSSESSIEKTTASAFGGDGGGGDGDSGYASTSGTSTSKRPTLSTSTSEKATSSSASGRYCDLHQRLYPGLNLHQSRTKLLRESLGGSKALNAQKPASTTKFMHRRYRPTFLGGRASPTADYSTEQLVEETVRGTCPDCEARNNHGNHDAAAAATSASGGRSASQSVANTPTVIDYRKVVLADCLRDVILLDAQQDPNNCVDSFVDELVGRFDRYRSSSQEAGGGNFRKDNRERTLRKVFQSGSNSSNSHGNGRPFVHSRSFEQNSSASESASGKTATPSDTPSSAQWPRLSDSSLATTNLNSSNNNVPYNASRNSNTSYHHHQPQPQPNNSHRPASGKTAVIYHRSLSDDNGGEGTTPSATTVSADKPPQAPTTRDQALKYFAAFPALMGKFGSLSATASGAGGSRSSSVSRQASSTTATSGHLSSGSSQLKSSTASLAKMSAQSSLDDSVFGEDTGAGDGSWNGLKIIKNISKTGAGAVSAASGESGTNVAGSLGGAQDNSNSSSTSTKPPNTLSGKSRIIVAAAPANLLLDSTRDSSNFTTLKKKVVSSSGGGQQSMVRRSTASLAPTTTSSSSSTSAEEASSLKSSGSSALHPSKEVVSREQEKIFNIMPSYMNPFKGSATPSKQSSAMSSSRKVQTTTATAQSSNASIVSGSRLMHSTLSSASASSPSTSTANGSAKVYTSNSLNISSTTTSAKHHQPSFTSSSNTFFSSSGRTGRIVRSGILPTASSSSTSTHTTSNSIRTTLSSSISTSSSSSSAVDLLPSYLSFLRDTGSSSSSSSNKQPAYHQQQKHHSSHQQQHPLQYREVKPDLRSAGPPQQPPPPSTSSAAASLSSTLTEKSCHTANGNNERFSQVQSTKVSLGGEQQQQQIQSVAMISAQQPQQQQQLSYLSHHQQQQSSAKAPTQLDSFTNAFTTTSAGQTSSAQWRSSSGNPETKDAKESTSIAGRQLNDYWFNFIEGEEASHDHRQPSEEEQVSKKVEAQVSRTADVSCEMTTTDEVQVQSWSAEDDECNEQEQQQQPQLVIDSKGALDEWMNSILVAQKLKRAGGKVVPPSTASADEMAAQNGQRPLNEDHFTEPIQEEEELDPKRTGPETTSGEGIQEFLDSIRQSIGGVEHQSQQIPPVTTRSNSINCWKPLNCNSSTINNLLHLEDTCSSSSQGRKPTFDYVSYYWNQNCTLGYLGGGLNFTSAGEAGDFEEGTSGGKSFRQYQDEQIVHQSEINLLAGLFAQSQQQQALSASFSSAGQHPHFQSDPSSIGGGEEEVVVGCDPHGVTTFSSRRISLANHEAESSAFQELLPGTSNSFTSSSDVPRQMFFQKDDTLSRTSTEHCQSATTSSSSTYFQPIDCPLEVEDNLQSSNELLNQVEAQTDADWMTLFSGQAERKNPMMNRSRVRALRASASASMSPTTSTTTANSPSVNKPICQQAHLSTSPSVNSSAASRSISVSRAELDTYFTPTTELSTNDNEVEVDGDDQQTMRIRTTTATTNATDFYSSPPTKGVSRLKREEDTSEDGNFVVKKLSNSACACKTSCGGHFVESACCCIPDEYHCRLGGDSGRRILSPEDSAAEGDAHSTCDKSTTTSTDHLLDAVKETLLKDCLGQEHQQFLPSTSASTSKLIVNNNNSPARRRLRAAAPPPMDLFSNHPFLAASFAAAGGDGNNNNINNNASSNVASKNQTVVIEEDEEELNVNDLVNSVLRLTTTADDLVDEEEIDGGHFSLQPSVFGESSADLVFPPIMSLMSFDQTDFGGQLKDGNNVNSVNKTTEKVDLDDYSGPPMPYSKRKKLQQSGLTYGQGLSNEQTEQLRVMSQNKLASNATFSEAFSNSSSSKRGPSLNSSASTSTSTLSNSGVGGGGNNTIYYSNRSSHQHNSQQNNNLFGGDSFALDDGLQRRPSPSLGGSPLFGGLDAYDGGQHHGLYDDVAFYEAADGKSGESVAAGFEYVTGPDGAQYYVGGDEDQVGDGDGSGGLAGARGSSGYSAEELYAQYGADAYAVIQHEDPSLLLMQSGSSSGSAIKGGPASGSQYAAMFDLKFKTSSRTIDNTIESTVPLKQSQKPCTFYMEGFCARGDCKFSHDLSSITCKYWLEGFCIKEGICPFLHGFPDDDAKKPPPQVEHSKLDPNAKAFQFKIESDFDFPALAAEDEDSGYGLDVDVPLNGFPSLADASSSSSAALQQLFFGNGGTGNRINFASPSTASKVVSAAAKGSASATFKSLTSNGTASSLTTSNGHAVAAEEEWPSLNGLMNGSSSSSSHHHQSADLSGKVSSLSSAFQDRVNFREKVIKSKKSKSGISRGSATTGSSGASSSSASASNASSGPGGSKYTALKGFL